jgi:hypothetical protein
MSLPILEKIKVVASKHLYFDGNYLRPDFIFAVLEKYKFFNFLFFSLLASQVIYY